MEILLTSAVLATLITSIVNLRISARSVRSQIDLEKLKHDIAQGLKALEQAHRAVSDLRLWVASNNVSTLAAQHKPFGDQAFSEFCVTHVPNLMMEYSRRLDVVRVFLKDDRAQRIDEAAGMVRTRMKDLSYLLRGNCSPQAQVNDAARSMLESFAAFNELIEKELDAAVAGSGAVQKI
jgi:hypothetical protein